MSLKLAVYSRYSRTKKDGTDVSIASQHREAKKFIKKYKIKDFEFFDDEGITAATKTKKKDEKGDIVETVRDTIKSRPEFTRMITLIEDGKINAVWCYDQSRIVRNTHIWSFFANIIKKHDIKYYEGGNLKDLNDPEIKLQTDIMGAMDEYFAAKIGIKVKMAIDINAEKGITHGVTAYGYRRGKNKKYSIEKKEAEVVKRIFDLSLSGVGTYSIAKILNSDGVKTKFNKFKGVIKRKDPDSDTVQEFKKRRSDGEGMLSMT